MIAIKICKIKASRTKRARIKSIEASMKFEMTSKAFFLLSNSDGAFSDGATSNSISCIFLQNSSKKTNLMLKYSKAKYIWSQNIWIYFI